MSKIIQKGDDILSQKAREIKREELSSDYLQRLLKKMKEALEEEKDGFAVAAPQIGESVRVFLVSGKLFQCIKNTTELHSDKVYVNPIILKSSKETEMMEEGCLSVRNWYGKVKRFKKVKIEALNKDGEKFQEGASGVLAQAFQHEIDHLNGVLFTDIAVDLKEVQPALKKK